MPYTSASSVPQNKANFHCCADQAIGVPRGPSVRNKANLPLDGLGRRWRAIVQNKPNSGGSIGGESGACGTNKANFRPDRKEPGVPVEPIVRNKANFGEPAGRSWRPIVQNKPNFGGYRRSSAFISSLMRDIDGEAASVLQY